MANTCPVVALPVRDLTFEFEDVCGRDGNGVNQKVNRDGLEILYQGVFGSGAPEERPDESPVRGWRHREPPAAGQPEIDPAREVVPIPNAGDGIDILLGGEEGAHGG